ncbi:protein SLOW GREEN 1, chloroplastic-like [Iris pallida]|uniref:Protein SLOW GREEN 1, chloroplastic-like n=1 Tax=Iris pallida TaxID=29817 RepID=A0AAX6FEX3_IRIPA|nr:protein SLOW GREEN 1, chloroplastic-like [Iris pallida]
MESIYRPFPNPLLSSRLSFPKTLIPSKTLTLTPPKPLISTIRASRNPNPAQTLISSVAKPALVALTAAAAFLISRHPKPSLAAAVASTPPPAQSEFLSDEQAERSLQSQLRSNPNDVTALRSLMELKVKSKKLPEAIAVADRLISLEPGENDLLILKAHLQTYSGELEAAKAGFEDILAKDPLVVEAYHGLVMMASQSGADSELEGILKRVETAMETCRKENRKAELKDFNLLVAQVRVIEGRYAEALKIYEDLVREEPRDFRPYLCQGIIYTLMKKKDEAERHFEKYRKLVPKEHPYAQFFDHNMNAMKGFSQVA